SNRSFRPEDAKQLDLVRRQLRRLKARSFAPPEERLEHLIDVFNETSQSRRRFCSPSPERLRHEVESLRPRFPESIRGTALRLLACIAWQTEGPDAGARLFCEAAQADRTLGNTIAELHTLTNWQRHTGSGGVRDYLSIREHRRMNEF